MVRLLNKLQDILDALRALDFLAPLALRLYLAPIFWIAGVNKLSHFDSTVEWFGNPEWGLGLPQPFVMTALATGTEVVGAVCLLFGFAVRWISIPLMATMAVAAFSVHWRNGWQAVADGSSPFAAEALGILQLEDISGAAQRLQQAKAILQEHGNYDWLTEAGNFVISNNGIEWATTYFIMLLALLFIGGGRYVSMDFWIARGFRIKN